MASSITNISSQASEIYSQIIFGLPPWLQNFLNILFLIVLVTLFCIFVWKIYTIMAKKNIIKLNLNKYNKSSHPVLVKILEGFFYLLEYMIILPFLVLSWFMVFTFFLLFLTKGLEIQTVLLISTVIIVAIRATAYYREELSRELAKLLPFTLLAVSMTEKGFFDFQEILNKVSQLPSFFGSILSYILIIIVLEIILRAFDLLLYALGLKEFNQDDDSDDDEDNDKDDKEDDNEDKRKVKKTK
jgi:NADH:ubiquinone oxidoreductase subunit 3 (subunit A)